MKFQVITGLHPTFAYRNLFVDFSSYLYLDPCICKIFPWKRNVKRSHCWPKKVQFNITFGNRIVGAASVLHILRIGVLQMQGYKYNLMLTLLSFTRAGILSRQMPFGRSTFIGIGSFIIDSWTSFDAFRINIRKKWQFEDFFMQIFRSNWLHL